MEILHTQAPPPPPCAIIKSAHGNMSPSTTKSRQRISNAKAADDKTEWVYKCHRNRSILCTKDTCSVAFVRLSYMVVMLLKWSAFCRIQWVIAYLVWNKLLQFKNKELDSGPSDVNWKTLLRTWFHSAEMLFRKRELTSPLHVWFSEYSWF